MPAIVFALASFVASSACAETVSADGFGDTASNAITNAAVNAIRTVSGSRLAIKQEFTSNTVNGVPDEKFIEKMLEVSNGTVKHLQIVSVKQIGDVYQASVIVEVDPGKLERSGSTGGELELRPGALAGGIAQAELKKGASEQLQDAFDEFAAITSKSVTIISASAEDDPAILESLRYRNLLAEGQVPIRVALSITTDPSIVSELKSALDASGKEIALKSDFETYGNGLVEGMYDCNSTSPSMTSFQVAFLERDADAKSRRGTISCGQIYTGYVSRITGIPSKVFVTDSTIKVGKIFDNATLHIRFLADNKVVKDASFGVDALYNAAWIEDPAVILWANGEGEPYVPESLARTNLNASNPLQMETRFSPTSLVGQSARQDPRGVVVVPELAYTFSLALDADVAQQLTSVQAEITSP